jgi:hypothetical protein
MAVTAQLDIIAISPPEKSVQVNVGHKVRWTPIGDMNKMPLPGTEPRLCGP